jgi:cycloeucalenol cycloisomerase
MVIWTRVFPIPSLRRPLDSLHSPTQHTMNEPFASIEATMAAILVTMFTVLVGMHSLQLSASPPSKTPSTRTSLSLLQSLPLQLPDPLTEPSKYCYEIFCWYYSIVWIGIFGFIVVSQCYEYFTAWSYLGVCGGLALPLMLQPMVYPQAWKATVDGKPIINPDAHQSFTQRYSTKATLYLFIYSFIGNYWYTHYFYSVLKAKYTMPSHRLNDIPIAMFLATHFYFCTYHVCVSNSILRFVDRSYKNGWRKSVLFWYTVLFLSYFTAFVETLSISSFPYYSFEDRTMAYVWGSAFYGIYFIVSFPGFYYFDADVDYVGSTKQQHKHITLMDTFTTACGHGMMILTLLDFVRLYLGIPLKIGGVAFAST